MAKAILKGNEIFGNVHLGEGGDVANPNIADVYDPTQTYNTGDRRIYDDVLYVCNDNNVTGAWDSTKWDSATIDEIISALTAADIPYSSGVSVADMLNVSNNIMLNEGSLYSTYVNNKFDYYYNQYGKLVLFTLDFEMKARSGSSGWGEIFKTPSTISLKNAVIVSCISSLNNWNRVRINSNGTVDLNLVSSASSTERVSIQIMAFLA